MINRLRTLLHARARAFTLIETLLAVLILSTAVAGPLTIASRGLGAALISKDKTTAFYLAQDAIEYVRFKRDTNRLSGNEWLLGLDGANGCVSTDGSAACYLDSMEQNPASATSCAAATCAAFPLYWDAGNHAYTYNTAGTTQSLFTRTITITTPVGSNADEAALKVTITWRDTGGNTRSLTEREDLFNWQ